MYDSSKIRRVLDYFWDSESQLSDFENDIVCLGNTYRPSPSPETGEGKNCTSTSGSPTLWPPDFLDDVTARIWMSYRTNFPLIPRSSKGPSLVSLSSILGSRRLDLNGFTSDVGWGCMIRTSQSLLANCISNLKLGRKWRCPKDGTVDLQEAEILMTFLDTPEAPYSLHNYVQHGEAACGKRPGEWFGPSAAASSIKALHSQYPQNFRVYISNGADIYENQLLQIAENNGEFTPTLILLGLRLGIDTVNPIYWDGLKQLLSCSQSVGIAGGRPSSSHYFFGYQGEYLFYLDPHFPHPCIEASSASDLTTENVNSFHTTKIRKLHLKEMDPSMLVGILVKDLGDWISWKESVAQSVVGKFVQISREPCVNVRSSVSVGSDDEEEGFVDVLIADEARVSIPEPEDRNLTFANKVQDRKGKLPVDEREVVGVDTGAPTVRGEQPPFSLLAPQVQIEAKTPSTAADIPATEINNKHESALGASVSEEESSRLSALVDPIDAAVEKLKSLDSVEN